MKIALVHDYLNEYGGAERVLEALVEMYPDAPIYTAFYKKGSSAYERFKKRDIRVSWAHHLPFFARKLHSPLRFLAPHIWQSFDFSGFDVVISSSSWYMTKGIRVPKTTLHVSYIHTPPRYLYGYDTSINWRKYWPIRVYAAIVNKELRQFDYNTAQTVDVLVANSHNVQKRIEKFWRRTSTVIYPPVELQGLPETISTKQGDYLLVISRLVGGKGLGLAVEAANRLHMPLKVVGTGAGWGHEEQDLKALAGPTVEFLGHVSDDKLGTLYAKAYAFLALAKDEDFGITPVEAQLAGTPVVAYRGGGYLETVEAGKTGVFFDELSVEGLVKGLEACKKISFNRSAIQHHAQKFSKERFIQEMSELVQRELEKKT